ncbi:probable glutathione S-transferase parA [Rhodamnia argentea]|uniref:glutathione transferase n=1 Tax=Rhodamnia argentea TaxID=178133 RepID=A0ABM3H2V1_9MYRT|nr:probable glutathione S-transferase parA [Rhodamnia argentea]
MADDDDDVTLFGFWASMFGIQCRLALTLKGIEYKYKEEADLFDQSPSLVQLNPVFKGIPVLIHNGKSVSKPVCESPVILDYIDEAWHNKVPFFPSDPYGRSQARFWADYIDKTLYVPGKNVWMKKKGKEQEAARKEVVDGLKAMEGELGEKPFFGGDKLGLVDLVLLSYSCWFHTFEMFGNFSIKAEAPKLIEWVRRCMEQESVSWLLPDPDKVYASVLQCKKKYGLE